jgi:hypothetical protein
MTEREQRLAETSSTSGRRGFLAGAGTVAGLAFLGDSVGASVVGPSQGPAATDDIDTGPLPYAQLDAEAALELGRQNYHSGMHCSEGSLNAIVTLLREEVGGVWNDIPTSASLWAKGGGIGWGSICGGVVGPNTAIALVYGRGEEGKMNAVVDEFQRWYTQHPFPEYTPPDSASGITRELPQSRSGSLLCHSSVTNWCKASGLASGSSERSERCSRLTGETAARAIELLNAEHAGNLDAKRNAKTPSTVDSKNGCRSCHFKGGSVEKGQMTRGKMECLQCHDAGAHLPDSLK